jgi:multiple antibiotic resistance protein
LIGPGEIFTLFFITLGPLKVLGPFAQQTASLEPAAMRGIALRVFVISVVALGIGGWAGRALAINWKVSIPALLIAAAVIFFLVALSLVLEQYEPPHAHAAPPLPAKPLAAAMQLTFPTVVTPYGIAALIVLLAATQDMVREGMIFGIAFGVMVLNLLAMLFARTIMRGPMLLGMRLLGAVLGVLQVALAVQIFLGALQRLGVIAG